MRWVPLESSPEVFNSYLSDLGIHNFEFCDVFSLDEDLLALIPRPVLSLLIVFPYAPPEDDRPLFTSDDPAYSSIHWFKQNVGNACGTIGLLHSFAHLKVDNGLLKQLLDQWLPLNTEERASAVANSSQLQEIHGRHAQQGQSQAPSAEDPVDLHYVSFTKVDDQLVELDGERQGPVMHGELAGDLLSPKVLDIVRKYFSRGNVSIIALT